MTHVNCAIYTRKSTDEGLEKEFNSLDAQREACEAYIVSQKHAGWVAVRDLYDDGGLSGGTMERPALRRLLADIKAGKVQIVVVYKVDRLTRSLSDFAKIVDIFDAHGASFVSVTQQFNTTTSMGRLTLNVLLSFAQFEREISGERIRDKIAASKAKGMWMGGVVPLGYDVKDRKLVINVAEAKTVRLIFERYTQLGSVTLLQAELDRRGFRSKRRERAGGRFAGGLKFSRGVLYLTLQNRVYRGEVTHKGNVYPGQHEAIVDADLWKVVKDKLASNRRARALAIGAEAPSLLSGLIFDSDGNRMTPTHANKQGRRYRYYISASLLGRGVPGPHTMRVPAGEIDGLILDRLRALLTSPVEVAKSLDPLNLETRWLDPVLRRAAEIGRKWSTLPTENLRALVLKIVDRVNIAPDRIEITIGLTRLAQALGAEDDVAVNRPKSTVVLSIKAKLRRAGKGKCMVIGEQLREQANPSLVRLMQEAFAAKALLLADTDESINAISARIGKCKGRLTSLVRLSYLAPSIVEDILAGRHPVEMSAKRLLRPSKDLPFDWLDQRKFLGLSS